MQVVVLIILLIVGFTFIVKLTYHGLPGKIALSGVAAMFVAFSVDTAASQSKTQIASWLSSPEMMIDAAVFLTIDIAAQVAFCFLKARRLEKPLSRQLNAILETLLWFPGLLIFPTLLALLTETLFSFPGLDFETAGYLLASAVLLGFPLVAWFLKWLLPEDDIRLELLFLGSLLAAALGVAATVNGRTAAAGTNSVEWGALCAVILIFAIGCAAGMVLNKYLSDKKIKRI